MISRQGRDNEGEAGHEPPDSFSLGVRRIKGIRNSMGKGGAFWYKKEGRGRDRGRYEYENTNPRHAEERLEDPHQSSPLLSSQLLSLIQAISILAPFLFVHRSSGWNCAWWDDRNAATPSRSHHTHSTCN